MREEVDEVNTVLKNYVQIKDLPETADLSDYYTKTESDNKYVLKGETNSTSGREYDDLTYKISQPFSVANFNYYANIQGTESLEGVHLVGTYTRSGEVRNFDMIFHNEGRFLNGAAYYNYCLIETIGNENVYLKYNGYDSKCNEISAGSNSSLISYNTTITLAEQIVTDDTIALKSDIPTDYVKTTDDSTIKGLLTVKNTDTSSKSRIGISTSTTNLSDNQYILNYIGCGDNNNNEMAYFGYGKPETCYLGVKTTTNGSSKLNDIIKYNTTDITLCKPTAIISGLTINSSQATNEAGLIDVNTTGTNNWMKGLSILAPNLANNCRIINVIGKGISKEDFAYFGYHHPNRGFIGLNMNDDIITFNATDINLNKNTSITGNLTVSGTITGKTNTTITHCYSHGYSLQRK